MECRWQMIWAQRPFPKAGRAEAPVIFLKSCLKWHSLQTNSAGVPLRGPGATWTVEIGKPSKRWQRKEAIPQLVGRGAGWFPPPPRGIPTALGAECWGVIIGESGRAAIWAWLDSRPGKRSHRSGWDQQAPWEISSFMIWLVWGHWGSGSRSQDCLKVLAALCLGKQLGTSLDSLSTC